MSVLVSRSGEGLFSGLPASPAQFICKRLHFFSFFLQKTAWPYENCLLGTVLGIRLFPDQWLGTVWKYVS